MSQGNPEEAGKIYEELCRMEQLTAAERGVALFGLGTCLFLHESYAAASLQLRESWELLIASLGMEDPLTTRTMVLLSRTLIALGDLESGMEIGRGALKNLVKLYGQDADQAATAAFFLSSGAYQFGRLAEAEELPEVDVQPASRPASRAAHTSRERIRLRVIEKTSFYRFPVEDRGNLWGTALVYCAAGRLSIGVCRTIFNLPCTNCTNFAPIFCLRAGLTIFALARIIQS